MDEKLFSRRDFLKLAGMLGLAPLVNALPHGHVQQPAGSTAPPNVIILLFDAMSARNLSLYGYHRRTTPNFERLAKRATVYHNHHSAGNYTTPSTASFFSGVYPWTHRAFGLGALITQSVVPNNMFQLLEQKYYQAVFTQNIFADILLYQFEKHLQRHVGLDSYNLAGFMIHNHLFPKDGVYGYKSYDQFLFKREEAHGSLFLSILNDLALGLQVRYKTEQLKDLYPGGLPRAASTDVHFSLEKVMDGLFGLLTRLPAPFYAYLHVLPPHGPYKPNREYAGLFDDGWAPPAKKRHPLANGPSEEKINKQRQIYDEFVLNTDADFQMLLDSLDSSGLLDNTYLIITSDHGEMFERGELSHSTPLLFESVIHVPLMVVAPGQQERRDVYDLTNTVDLLPTLLQIAGLPIPEWCAGRPLPGLGWESGPERSTYAVEALKNPAHSPLRKASIAIMRGPYKLVRYMGYRNKDTFELYDLQNDPEELNDLYATHPIARELQAEMEQDMAKADAPYLAGS